MRYLILCIFILGCSQKEYKQDILYDKTDNIVIGYADTYLPIEELDKGELNGE